MKTDKAELITAALGLVIALLVIALCFVQAGLNDAAIAALGH